jgi:hypothetical protein
MPEPQAVTSTALASHRAQSRASFQRRGTNVSRTSCMLLVVVAVLSIPSLSRADVQACVDAHSEAQLKRDESDFVAARALFGRCVDAACPEPIRLECGTLLAKLDETMPTVVLGAVDERGADVPGVRVEVDGKPYLDGLTGRATPINPGSHTFVFTRPDGTTTTSTALVLEGVKGREISGRFVAAHSSVPPVQAPRDPGSGQKTLAYVLGGAGVVALGAFSYFALSGKGQLDELRDDCAPRCTHAQANSVKSKYLLADLSLGAAAALLGSGAYLYFSAPSSARAEQALSAGFRGKF